MKKAGARMRRPSSSHGPFRCFRAGAAGTKASNERTVELEQIATVAACAAAGAAVGGTWPYATKAFLSYKYDDMARRWKKRRDELAEFLSASPDGAAPDPDADGDEGVLGIWAEAQIARKQWGHMTEDEHESLAEAGLDLSSVPGRLKTDAQRRSEGFELDASVPMAILCAVAGAAGAGCFAAIAGMQSLGWLLVCALFAVAVYTDAKCHHTSWQIWIALDAVSAVQVLAFQGAAGLAEGAFAALAACAAFGLAHLFAKLAARFRNKRIAAAGGAPAAAAPAVGFGDYMLILPICLCCGAVGSLAAIGAALFAMLAWTAVGMFRHRVTTQSFLPMAPSLGIGLVVGLAVRALF